jgi:hypothetical protein
MGLLGLASRGVTCPRLNPSFWRSCSSGPNSVHLYIRLALICLGSGRIYEARVRMQQAQATNALTPELAFLGTIVRL